MVRLSVVFMMFLSIVIGCGDKIEPGHKAASGNVATVKAKTAVAQYIRQPYLYDAVGTVQAKLESTLSSKLMATVRSIRVREGDKVRKGDVLVILDPIQADAGLNQAQAALEEARRAQSAASSAQNAAAAEAELAKSTYQRYQQLMKENSVSRQEFEEVRAKFSASQAALASAREMLKAAAQKVEQAKAGLDSAKATKSDTELRAPYDGVITAKRMEEGSLAAPGTPILAVEGGNEGFRADITVPDSYLSAIAMGQTLKVSIPNLGGAGLPLQLDGVVQTIVPISDAASRSFIVKISLPDAAKVRSGMFARVSIPVGEGGMMLIPKSAIILQGQLTGVFKVDTDKKARFRLIRTGREMGDQVEILSGLKDGERFVVMPVVGLADGATVEDAS
jgi:RND family efflux transporter MFP subunit